METHGRTAADSREAIGRLFQDDGARLERALILYAGDREVARDAVAESFALALEHSGKVRTPRAWVWTVAFRVATADIRRQRNLVPGQEAAYDVPEPARDLIQALRQLSPKQRGALVMHHYAGYPVKEVARMLGSTPGAVSVHLVRARRRLRDLMEGTDERT